MEFGCLTSSAIPTSGTNQVTSFSLRRFSGKEAKRTAGYNEKDQELLHKSISNYIFYEKILPNDRKIKEFAKIIFDIAEQTKLSTKRFTPTDISTYTYKFIFDKELGFVKLTIK